MHRPSSATSIQVPLTTFVRSIISLERLSDQKAHSLVDGMGANGIDDDDDEESGASEDEEDDENDEDIDLEAESKRPSKKSRKD